MIARLAIVSVLALLVFAPSALAQGSAEQTYGGNGASEVLAESGSGSDGATATTDAGSLPFTGLDLTLALGGALVLLGTGLGISRFVARGETA